MKRRKFINWAGLGLLASYFPIALAACSETSTDSNNSSETESNTPNTERFLSVGTTAQLQETGYLLNEESQVIVVQNNKNQLIALDPTCTHQGCIVEWEKASNTLVCPCHNAKYAPDGKVLAEPAKAPLLIYEVKEEDGTILVKVT